MKIICKRILRRWTVFLLLLAAPVLAVQVSRSEEPPPAGFCMAQEDAITGRIAQHLLQNGFVEYADPTRIPELVRRGELDCGAVFPENFGKAVSEGDLSESIIFYASPSSYLPELYKSHITAAVFRECVPYISAEAFADTEVTQEAVLQAYQAMLDEGYAFSFDVVTAEGTAAPAQVKSRSVAMGAAAILLLTVLLALCAGTVENSFDTMLPRLGLRKAVTAVLLPEILMNALCAAVFCGVGFVLAGLPDMVLPTAVYCLLLCGVGLLLTAVFRTAGRIHVLLPVLVIGAAALCPIYVDLAPMIPAVAAVRPMIPAYWLWQIPDAPILWAVAAATVFAAGVLSVILRYRGSGKYKY